MVGPGADLGGDSGRLQPVRAGAAAGRRLEGRARLAPRDGAALVGLALPRPCAPARPARRPAAASARPSGRSGYRARVSVALGGMALLLVAIPFVPAVAGVGGSTVRYSYEPRLTREVTGQFVSTKRGPVKLFAWSDPQSTYASGRASAPCAGRALAAGPRRRPGRAKAYQLYDLDRGGSVLLRASRASPRELALAPRAAAAAGRATRSSPRTRGCSGDATSPTCASCRRLCRSRRSAPGRTRRSRRARRAAAALRGAARARVRGAAPALVAAPPLGREGALGPRLPPLRGRRRLRGGRAADRLERGALPHLLPRRRRADRRLPRCRLGLAAAAEPRRATGSPAGSRSRRRRRW